MNPILRLEHIAKAYDGHSVLINATLMLNAGECVAVTGINGCGKSTLLRIAVGLTRADTGFVTTTPGLRIQYVPDAFPRLPLKQRSFIRALEKIDCGDLSSLIREFSLADAQENSIRDFSKGMLGKIAALQALGAPADLLVLDEPLSGMDAAAHDTFLRHVRARMRDGCAVLLAYHGQDLADALAARVYIVHEGRLVPQTSCAKTTGITSDDCLCPQCARFAHGDCAGRSVYNA
ncbi:MAG: ATP-binding cassette domain-containing protein [Eubacteriales bacterium]|nr:ATP-binding cassette domain-containing protein [Eubacteriales bacterium]